MSHPDPRYDASEEEMSDPEASPRYGDCEEVSHAEEAHHPDADCDVCNQPQYYSFPIESERAEFISDVLRLDSDAEIFTSKDTTHKDSQFLVGVKLSKWGLQRLLRHHIYTTQ